MNSQRTTTREWALAVAILANVLVPFLLHPYNGTLAKSRLAHWLYAESLNTLLPLVSMIVLWRLFRISPAQYGLRWPLRYYGDLLGKSMLVAVSIGVVYLVSVSVLWRYWWPFLDIHASAHQQALAPSAWHSLAVVQMSICAGYFESVIFIGWPWLMLKDRRASPGAFACLSALAFGLSHQGHGLHEVVATTLFGLVAASWYLKLRNLWPVVFGHAVVDTYVLI